MVEVEVFGEALLPDGPAPAEVARLCALVAARLDVREGHVAVEFVASKRIAQLNLEHRGRPSPTDVLSFPMDGVEEEPEGVPRELGDVVICPEHTADVREAVVHGMLHLLGMDHESDAGEMLALQDELMEAPAS
jgi:probable rRNA maturation factor